MDNRLFTVSDLQRKIASYNKGCDIITNGYTISLWYDCFSYSRRDCFSYSRHGETFSEIEVGISYRKARINPNNIKGFIWGEYFSLPFQAVGRYVPLQTVCDIVNFFNSYKEE